MHTAPLGLVDISNADRDQEFTDVVVRRTAGIESSPVYAGSLARVLPTPAGALGKKRSQAALDLSGGATGDQGEKDETQRKTRETTRRH